MTSLTSRFATHHCLPPRCPRSCSMSAPLLSPLRQSVARGTTSSQGRCRKPTACSAAPAAPAAESGPQPADVPVVPAQPQGSGRGLAPDAVTVSEEKMPRSHVRLTVTVPPTFVRKCYDKGLKQLRAKTPVPGFRPGKKVPQHILIDALGGVDVVNGTCVERVLKDVLPVALERYKDTAVTESEHIEEQFEDLIRGLDLDAPFTFHVGLDVKAAHSWKSPYRDIEVEVPRIGDEESDAAEVEAKLQQLLKSKGSMKVVLRPLQVGDVAIVDFKVTRVDTDELIAGSERRGMQLDTGLGDRAIGLNGVVEGMAGMSTGEAREIATTVGDTWWEPDALRGVDLRCDIALNEVFEWDLPQLTDEFVAGLFPGVGTVKALRAQLMRTIAAQRQEDQQDRIHAALIRAVADRVEADVPESAIRQLAENEYQAHLHEIQLREQMNFEQVNKLATQELLERFTESRREDLRRVTLSTLGMEDIFAAEGLGPLTEEEIKKEMSDAADQFTAAGEEFDEGRLREQVAEVLKAEKVLTWLEQNTKVHLR